MKNLRLAILFILLSPILSGQPLRKFFDHLNALPFTERQKVVDSFFNVNSHFPCIEQDTVVYFIYQVSPQHISIDSDTLIKVTLQVPNQRVSVAGDFNGWQPALEMINIPGTNLWYAYASFEPDARLDYKFVINGKNWVMDTKNPFICTGGFGPNSELRMPKYILPVGLDYDATIPHGTIHDTMIYSQKLANRRAVKVYLPPGYTNHQLKYPVILFHDGSDYINLGQVNNLIDWLIRNHEIEPVIGIFVEPVDRENEYAGNKVKTFTYFIIHELMPLMEEKYAISKDPHKRATVGASLGGNIALSLGIAHPERFGKIAAQSSFVSKKVSGSYRNGKKQDIVLYLDLGKYDLYNLIPLVHNFIPDLRFKNYKYQYYEFPEGHSWGNWKAHLNLFLKQFFPSEANINTH